MQHEVKKITFEQTDTDIVIKIPIDLIVFAQENHPEFPIIVNNKREFISEVIQQLDGKLYNQETGLTDFQDLLDNASFEACITGDAVDFKYDNKP